MKQQQQQQQQQHPELHFSNFKVSIRWPWK